MRSSDFDDFDSLETQGLLAGSKERSWLWFGLIVSLGLHFALCTYFYRTQFGSVAAVIAPDEQTSTFKVRSIEESSLEKSSIDSTNPAAKPEPDNTDVQLPDEKKSFDQILQDIQASAALPDDVRDVLPDQPKVEQSDVNSVLTEIERSTAQSLADDPNATRNQSLLNNSSASGRPQPALSGTELATSTTIKRPNTFTSKMPGDSAGPNRGRAPGFTIWINCSRKKAHSDRGQNCECRTTNCSNMTATCYKQAPLGNCISLAPLSSAIRKPHSRWKAIRIHLGHRNTISI
jgi:hypothetical protein